MLVNLEKDSVIKSLIKLGLPSMIAQVVNMLYNLIDRIFVSNIGTQALSALGVCFPITLILSSFSALFGMGGAPLSSIKLGEKNNKDANIIFNQVIFFLGIIGFILTIVTFVFSKDILLLFGCPDDSLDYAVSYLKIYSLGTIFTLFTLGLNPFINAQGYALISMSTTLIGAICNLCLYQYLFMYYL